MKRVEDFIVGVLIRGTEGVRNDSQVLEVPRCIENCASIGFLSSAPSGWSPMTSGGLIDLSRHMWFGGVVVTQSPRWIENS